MRLNRVTRNRQIQWTRPRSVYLGLGSNLGDREANLREAIKRINWLGLEVTGTSSIYETEPIGYTEQPWFLNQVVEVGVNPRITFNDDQEYAGFLKGASDEDIDLISQYWVYELFGALQNIEREMGRRRTMPDGPRAIDIDLLIYGESEGFFAETRSKDDNSGIAVAGPPFLRLPHPRMHERRFVLEPLCEIAPDLVHPVLKKTARQILASLNDQSVVRLYKKVENS